MAEYDVLGYQARDEGSAVAFYDSESCLFLVHASSAASQSQREDLMRTYIAGHKHGRISGQIQMQSEFRKLLNAAPLEPLHLEGP